MPGPIVLLHGGCSNRWPSEEQQRAIEAALRAAADVAIYLLNNRSTAVQIAVEIVAMLENCGLFNAGKGAAPTIEGDHEASLGYLLDHLEAGVVDGASGTYGAVAVTRSVKNPVRAALHLLAHGPHRFLVGPAVDDVVINNELDTVADEYFVTRGRQHHSGEQDSGDAPAMGSVGAIVLDHEGYLAAAGSTGGIPDGIKGRVGGTAVMGAGLLADDKIAVVCSGASDTILEKMTAANLARYCSDSLPMAEAVNAALQDVALSGETCAVLALDSRGNLGLASNACSFSVAAVHLAGPSTVSIWPPTSTIWYQACLYEDDLVVVGLTTYPSTPGHVKIQLRRPDASLLSHPNLELAQIMLIAKRVAAVLRHTYVARCCALVTTGDRTISLLPLHVSDAAWKAVESEVKVFHGVYPGYVTSQEGPTMPAEALTHVCNRIKEESGLKAPMDYSFQGADDDKHLFAQIIKGEVPHYRVWEDDEHVAFLTPSANTTGSTVLVPRSHSLSDVLRLDDKCYARLMIAAKNVAGLLMKSLGVPRCGMIFEGFKTDFAHVTLIPILSRGSPETDIGIPSVPAYGEFHKAYQGFVTSLDGPTAFSAPVLGSKAAKIRALLPL